MVWLRNKHSNSGSFYVYNVLGLKLLEWVIVWFQLGINKVVRICKCLEKSFLVYLSGIWTHSKEGTYFLLKIEYLFRGGKDQKLHNHTGLMNMWIVLRHTFSILISSSDHAVVARRRVYDYLLFTSFFRDKATRTLRCTRIGRPPAGQCWASCPTSAGETPCPARAQRAAHCLWAPATNKPS